MIQDSTNVHNLTVKANTNLHRVSFYHLSFHTNKIRQANAALLEEIGKGEVLPLLPEIKPNRRSERLYVRNIIIEEEHETCKTAVTKRKTILTCKRQIIDGKHVLITPEILSSIKTAEENIKKRKHLRQKKVKREAGKVKEKSIDESESSQHEGLEILDCM